MIRFTVTEYVISYFTSTLSHIILMELKTLKESDFIPSLNITNNVELLKCTIDDITDYIAGFIANQQCS
jgi:hypothetical protein